MLPGVEDVCQAAAGLIGNPWPVLDLTKVIQQPGNRRNMDKLQYIVLHRIEVGKDAESIAAWFAANPEWVGPRMPYGTIIPTSGEIQQAVLLNRLTYHAKAYNSLAVSIGIVGDFRPLDDLGGEEAHDGITGKLPTPEQVAGTIIACVRIREAVGQNLKIIDHTSIATPDEQKRCPGSLFPVAYVAAAVETFGRFQVG
jgi:hypothetical protein